MKLGGDKSVIWDCLVGFRECSSSCADSYIGVMLRKLLVYEGIAVEESGVYLECDEDFQMIPSYLVGREGCMAFEFMGKSFVCTMPEGAEIIRDWCERKVYRDREVVLEACNKLVSVYGESGLGKRK